jgi:hypothetical protein
MNSAGTNLSTGPFGPATGSFIDGLAGGPD